MPSNIIQTMPEDLWYLIFRHALPVSLLVSGSIPLEVSDFPPMNFSIVCHSWRRITLTQTSLWSSFEITFAASVPLSRSLLRIVELWLRNSAMAPLDIYFSGYIYHGEEDPVFRDIYDLILSQRHRWDVVYLDGGYPHFRGDQLDVAISSSSLTSLRFSVDTDFHPRPRFRWTWPFAHSYKRSTSVSEQS